jgi:hypothetical protein
MGFVRQDAYDLDAYDGSGMHRTESVGRNKVDVVEWVLQETGMRGR